MRNDGATIGGVHTSEYGLVMTGYEITYPEPDRIQRDIPYGPTLDFTEALLEDVPYKRRKLTMTFDLVGNYLDFETALLALSNAVHGQWLQVILDSDPAYYYQGVITVERAKDNPVDGDVVIVCDANPYKLERFPSDGTWEWDPFRFDTGIIRNYADLPVLVTPDTNTVARFQAGDVSLATKLVIPGCRQKVAPRFIFDGSAFSDSNALNGIWVLLLKPGETLQQNPLPAVVPLTAAQNWSPDIMIGAGDYTLYLLGVNYGGKSTAVSVSVDYRGGML